MMKTDQLLKSYLPRTPEERIYKSIILSFLNMHENAHSRDCHLGHFTASAWITNKQMDQVVLMHHKKLDKWLQLGGHCDGNPHCLEVALKEAHEESGLNHLKVLSEYIFDIDMHLIPPRGNERSHYHYDIRFLMMANTDDLLIGNHESCALRWIRLNEVHQKNSERSIMRMVEKTQAYKTSRLPAN